MCQYLYLGSPSVDLVLGCRDSECECSLVLSLCRVSLVSLRALAYVFITCEPKPRASCLSDWFSQVWTWNLIGLTLVTGLFLSQSPFPEGSTLTGPGWSAHPLQSQCWERGIVTDSLTKTTCTDGGVAQRKAGSVTRREMGIHTEQVKPQPTAVPITCRRLYCQVVGQNEAEPPSERAARPGLQYHPPGAATLKVQVAHSRWQPQSPLYFALYPPFPFWNHLSSREKGRRWMNCKHEWGTSSVPPSEYK